MSSIHRRTAGRLAVCAGTLALALALAGDRSRAATVPATVFGQDPMEILALKIRPNVIVVLDSSGSMESTVTNRGTGSGDHPRSKEVQAKAVLRQIIRDNDNKVSFQIGTYTQYSIDFNNQTPQRTDQPNRFQYATSAMPATELTLLGAKGDTNGRGLQSWQLIYPPRPGPPAQPGWNTFYYEELISGTTYSCTATLPTGSGPNGESFYGRGGKGATTDADVAGSLAVALKAAINACPRTTGRNAYDVTYDVGTGAFTIWRTSNSNSWRPLWDAAPDNIRAALGRPALVDVVQNVPSYSTRSPYRLLYRGAGAAFTENINGTDTTFYHLRAGRLWNGETVLVDGGQACGMTFATAATRTSPPSVTLQSADGNCTPGTDSAKFDFAGGFFGGNNRSCRGFRSKSDLVPCDLRKPPAPLQIVQALPYLDLEFPFDDDGDPLDITTNDATGGPGDPTAVPPVDPGVNYGRPDGIPDYVETQDGSWGVSFMAVSPSAKADGWTPIANSLIDIKGLADNSTGCLTNPAPTPGTPDPVSTGGVIGVCLERGFAKLWNQGQTGTTTMAGPPPYQLDPISTHLDPKEKTIVLFVTDGDDTCPVRRNEDCPRDRFGRCTDGTSGNGDDMDASALRAAYHAERLFTPLDASTPGNAAASSVSTFMIGYGGAFASGVPTRLNWIAWGGSGLGQGQSGQPDVPTAGSNCESAPGSTTLTGTGATGTCAWSQTPAQLTALRARCETCRDAYVAPDAATLARQLQGLIDQGAQVGEFSAQQSLTETVYEYSAFAALPERPGVDHRFSEFIPTLFVSSFTLPGFKGNVQAWQNSGVDADGDGFLDAVKVWSAGDKLLDGVATGMAGCDTTGGGGGLGVCGFAPLHGNQTDRTIGTSQAAIKRRIYTTDRNGVYPFTPLTLINGTASNRVTLWPPDTSVAPASYTTQGSLDLVLGLPADGATNPAAEFTRLQQEFFACQGSSLPSACTSTNNVTRMQAARREAREMMLAFMAGAKPVFDAAANGLLRANRNMNVLGVQVRSGEVLYMQRDWVLADSELATPGVVGPPMGCGGIGCVERFGSEFSMYANGVGAAADPSQVVQGFGLRNPDSDPTNDSEPRATVVYSPANDMLHAFRAGPSDVGACTSAYVTRMHPTVDCGGEELWGFVPYDQLNALRLRYINEPQTRDNHVYMLARGVRFTDMFVPNRDLEGRPVEGNFTATIGGVSRELPGVWRTILYFGRGIGGKYLTALDVTGIGPFDRRTNATAAPHPTGPIPLWSRGNVDTHDGTPGGTNNGFAGSPSDRDAYSFMGETWSMPAVVQVQTSLQRPDGSFVYSTPRRPAPAGPDFVLFVGSGYGARVGATSDYEGSVLYTLDALSGDVIAKADVEAVARSYGIARSLPYPNAIVSNVAAYNFKWFKVNVPVNPSSGVVTRAYVGDIHGRLWKVLASAPEVAIPVADLGADQPVGAAAALLALPHTEGGNPPPGQVPYVFLASGADSRQEGPFKIFAFRDEGSDTETTTGTGTTLDGVTTYPPAVMAFTQTFTRGGEDTGCGFTEETFFRGTMQPAVTYECTQGGNCMGQDTRGRAFFGGTRLNPPNTKFAPPTPLACGQGEYPCRSQFDTVLYALGARTGAAAYDLNASGDDAYRILRDSRITAISLIPDPAEPGGTRFNADEGQRKGPPKAPPKRGKPRTRQMGTVVFAPGDAGEPAGIRAGSLVCQKQ